MNLKNMTYGEITQLVASLTASRDIDEAIHKLDEMIGSLKIMRSMLEGRKVLRTKKERQERRKGLTVVRKKQR